MITIYGSDGTVKIEAPCDDNSTQEHELQGDNVLTLSFTLWEHVALEVNDWAEFMGRRYWLTERYRPEQKSTVEWKYDVKLYGPESLANRFLVLNDTDGADEAVFTLTAPASEHLRLIIDSINRGMGGAARLKAGTVAETGNIVSDYDGTYCGEALKALAEKCGTGVEWWLDGEYLNLCRCEAGEEVTLGYGKGLAGISCDMADNVRFYTRLYPIGSSRNIDPEKYGHTRLQLPGGAKHVDVNVEKYGVWDKFEEAAFADIYPRWTGEVSSVRYSPLDEDGKRNPRYYIRAKDQPFDPNDYEIGGKVKRISFETGDLAGLGEEDGGTYYFEANYDSDTHEYELITTWPYDDGTPLPNDRLCPKAGDLFMLWNIRMPDEYYPLAEQELKAAVDKYNEENAKDTRRFKGPTDHVYIEDKGIALYVGRRVRLESAQYFPETGYRSSRITKVTRRVNLPSQADVEISDAVGRGALDAIGDSVAAAESHIRELAGTFPEVLKSGDTSRPTEYNVLSALRSLGTLLRKDTADATPYLLRLLGGAEIGETVDSMLAGKGTLVTAGGRLQTDRLEVRGSMTVMDLVVNQIQAMAAECSLSDVGKITAVEALGEDTYRLTLERATEFDLTTFAEGDICYSIVNTLKTGGTDYYTSWMRVLTASAANNTVTVVAYADAAVPGGKNHAPAAGYNMTRRGNATMPDTEAGEVNERAQSWLISSREGRIMFLQNVFKPVLESWNYGIAIGKLPKTEALEQIPVAEGDLGVMADVVVARRFYEFDGNGRLVTKMVDRGEWSLAVATGDAPYRHSTHEWAQPSTGQRMVTLERHTVWHLGCKWGCLADKTVEEPKWNSAAWQMLEGDQTYYLALESTRGNLFRRGKVETVLAARVLQGDNDITELVLAAAGTETEWVRDSGDAASDNTWRPSYDGGSPLRVAIGNADMGADFGIGGTEVTFSCRVFIPVGGTEPLRVENRVAFR